MKKTDYVAMRTAVIKGRGMGWEIIGTGYCDGDQVDDRSIVGSNGSVVSGVKMVVGAGSCRGADAVWREIKDYGCKMRLEMTVDAESGIVNVVPVAEINGGIVTMMPCGWATIESYLKFLDSYSCVVDIEDALWRSAWEKNETAHEQLDSVMKQIAERRAEAETKAAEEADQLEFLSAIAAFEAKAQ